jgi:hypothetical protein
MKVSFNQLNNSGTKKKPKIDKLESDKQEYARIN